MDKSQYLTTGELAKLMHVTKNTLFHYDKIGLFSPEIVLDNEYRYYSIHQIEVLEAIIMLKELGMSLKEIQAFLSDRTPENYWSCLKRGTDSGRKNPAVKGSQAVDGRKK